MSEEALSGRADLAARIAERWGALSITVARLSEAEMERPLGDGWSAKVHLAHITAWEKSLLALLQGRDRGDAMGIAPDLWATHDTDAINLALANRALGRSLADVLDQSRGVHRELLELLDGMSDEDLAKPYSHYQPNDRTENQNPIVGWVVGNTWDHYDEHIRWLELGMADPGSRGP